MTCRTESRKRRTTITAAAKKKEMKKFFNLIIQFEWYKETFYGTYFIEVKLVFCLFCILDKKRSENKIRIILEIVKQLDIHEYSNNLNMMT